MPNHVVRLYALASALVAFFLAWAVVAAHPWTRTASDPRLRALAVREAQLRHEAKLVNALVERRWAAYRTALAARRAQIAATASVQPSAAPVRVVNLPPLTVTRTS